MVGPAPSLDCRLLSAAAAAYGIGAGGSFTKRQPYFDAIGFKTDPVVFAAGLDDINACLVGTNDDGVILAFRGTIAPNIHNLASLIDWFNDIFLSEPIAPGDGIEGKVHKGFWESTDTLWPLFLPEVKKQRDAGGGKILPLYITGHSKGGPLANFAAIRLLQEQNILPTGVVTFASPHPGDTTFATFYDSKIAADIRYEFGDDIVPHLVPDAEFIEIFARIPELGTVFRGMEKWHYGPLGTLKFIRWDKKTIVNDSETLKLERFGRLLVAILRAHFSEIAASHSSDCGGGYQGGVCPTGVCPPAVS